ncbi:light harvesting complex protein [Nannochloropsis oceanica]
MKCAMVVLGSLAMASAFVPAAPKMSRTRGVARMAVNEILGADVETGGVWDPLNFSKDEGSLYRYRAVELKHGRLAMLAVLGLWFSEFYHPLYDGKISPGLKAIGELPGAAWLQILAAIAVVELTIGKQDTENKAPGDLGFGLNFNPFKNDPEKFAELQLKELKNGRLAMLGAAGILLQEGLTGQTCFEQIAAQHLSPFGDGQGFF